MLISTFLPFLPCSYTRLGTDVKLSAVKFRATARRIFIAATALFAAHAFAEDLPFSQVTDPGTQVVNWVTGEYGAKFNNTSGESVTITQVGRWCRPGNSQKHTIRVYNTAGTLLGEATVNLAGAAANQFIYGTLATPVVVPAKGSVFILSTETAVGDSLFGPSGGGTVNYEDIGWIEVATKQGAGAPTAPAFYSRTFGPVSFKFSTPVRTWKKSGNVHRTDGSYYQVTSAIRAAAPGDSVLIPAGTYTWGASGDTLQVKDGVILTGESSSTTIINMSPASPTGYGNSLIVLGAGSTIRAMTFNGPDAANCPLIRTGANDWRISEIVYKQFPGRGSYFVNIQGSTRGLIDKCVITGGAGNSELVFARGPENAWDTANTLGGADNIFIEDSEWGGQGYVCDANANTRMVIRNNLITGGIKVDGHGVWSNSSPQRGVRHMEVYNNTWTASGNFTAMELRGGGGRVFNNVSTAAAGAGSPWLIVTEYGVFNNNGAFTDYQTPANYPIRDQIGRGRYALAGDPSSATSEPMYFWGNRRGGADWAWTTQAIPAASLLRYTQQLAVASATFKWNDIIQADRDYFKEVSSFNGSTGVGIGTKAQMQAIKGSKVGVGFWVTNEGDWNTSNGNTNDGQLYTWSGSAWTLSYTPYTYPHPRRLPAAPKPASLRKG